MRIVFAGTPQPAVPSLLALVDAGHEVPLVITRPDAPIGRRRVLTPSPVAAAGLELGLAVHRTARLDEEPPRFGPNDLHSEYFLPAADAAPAIKALRGLWAHHIFTPDNCSINGRGQVVVAMSTC